MMHLKVGVSIGFEFPALIQTHCDARTSIYLDYVPELPFPKKKNHSVNDEGQY